MGESNVGVEDVRHVAELACIELTEDEIEAFRAEFDTILEYFDRLEDVPPVDAEEQVATELRPDEVRESLSQTDALANATETEDGYFKGPPVS